MLVLTRSLGEQIQIGDRITVTVLRVSGKSVRIGIDAPQEYHIWRGELVYRECSGQPSQRAMGGQT
jgi:carbon storage regulator